jgi:RNA polymerase sigma factor (sigma-70 family)
VSTAVATAAEAPDQARLAFESLYRESRDDVYAYAAGLLRDDSAAEEVTAQAFERAWRKRRQIDRRRGSARAWLFGIARNACIDELRRRSRMTRLADQATEDLPDRGSRAPTGASEPGDPAELAVRRAALHQAMAALNARERELIGLKFFAGLSNSEIGAVIGSSETNAGTKLHRATIKLRRSLNEDA